MSLWTKVFGIDARRQAEDAATAAAKAADEARKKAEAQQLATETEQKLRQQTLDNISTESARLAQANQSAATGDTNSEATVIAGGMADSFAKKKKLPAPTMAASLGINI